jgi:hypothetical protein
VTCHGYQLGELTCREATRELHEFELDQWCDACRRELEESGVRYCRVCGCTDDDECEGGCTWVLGYFAPDGTWVPMALEGSLCSKCGALPS